MCQKPAGKSTARLVLMAVLIGQRPGQRLTAVNDQFHKHTQKEDKQNHRDQLDHRNAVAAV